MNDRHEQIGKIRWLIDRIAYYSLFLDIAIALITSLSLFHIYRTETLLVQVNYALTAVVILSMMLFGALFYLKHEQKLLDSLLGRKYVYRKKDIPLSKRMELRKIYDRNRKMLD